MPSRETTFEEVMNAWSVGASMFRADDQLYVPLFTNAGEVFPYDDEGDNSGSVRVARFSYAPLQFAVKPPGADKVHLFDVDVFYDTVTGYIVGSSHELEGYRMKDGQPDAPLGRIISDGSLVFERSEEARRFWATQANNGGGSDRSA
jgi:hypothetical protein